MSADLTELVNQLRSTLGRMETALGAITDAILWTDADGSIQWCNAAFDRLVNLPHIQVLNTKLSDILPLAQLGQLIVPTHYPHIKTLNGESEATEYEFWQSKTRRILEISGYCAHLPDSTSAVLVIRETTDRNQTEVALQKNEQRFKILVNNIPGAVYHCSFQADKSLDFVSHAVTDIYGYPAADYGHNPVRRLMDTCHPDDRERVNQEVDWAIAHQQPYALEYRITRSDGELRWVYERGQAMHSASGETLALNGLIFDITQRKQTEAALHRSEQKYRHIFENSQFGIGCTQPEDGLFLEINPRLAEILGYSSANDLIGQSSQQFYVDPGDRQHILKELRQGGIHNFELRLRRADGKLIWALLSIGWNREEPCLELVLTDISDRKRLEEELRQSQQFLNTIIEHIPVAIFVKDIRNDFRYVLMNQICETILGFSRTDSLGKNDYDLVPKERAEFYYSEDQNAVQQGIQSKPPIELIGTNSDGSVLTRTWKFPLFDSQGAATHLLCTAEDVTERTRAEAALRQSEARFRSLYESTSIAVLLQEEGIPLDCNRAAEKLFNAPRQLLLKTHPRDLSPPTQPNGQASSVLAKQHIALAYEQGNHRFEWVHRRVDGTDFPAEVHLTIFEVEGRKLVQGVVQDLTERKQAEACLQRRSQEDSLLSGISRQFIDRAETAIDFALEAIAQFIQVERICLFERTEQLFRVSDQWCDSSLQPVLPFKVATEGFPWFFNQILDNITVQIPCVAELPPEANAEKANFQSFQLQSVVCVPMVHAGKVVGYLCAAVIHTVRNWTQEDVSLLQRVGELIAIGKARHQAEEKFIKAFRASPSPITINTLSENRFVDVNSSFLRMSGYSLEEVIDHTAAELNMRIDPDAYHRTLKQALDTGSVQNHELEFRTKSGTVRTVLLSIELIDLSGQQCILNIVNDITERKRLENELISLVSHELRTPMTSLLGALDLLGSGQLGTLTPQGQQVLSIATNNTERLTRLVNDILDLERMRSGKIAMQKVTCNIADLITQATQTMQPMADKAEVMLIPEPIAVTCFVDADRLLQTLTNLLSNAIKFSSPHGKIWISAKLEPENLLHLAIQDQGRGIPPDKLQVIFDRFQQVDASDSRQKGGTGLGLAICRNIVEQHDGKIWVESSLGVGSMFHVTLPIASRAASLDLPDRGLV